MLSSNEKQMKAKILLLRVFSANFVHDYISLANSELINFQELLEIILFGLPVIGNCDKSVTARI